MIHLRLGSATRRSAPSSGTELGSADLDRITHVLVEGEDANYATRSFAPFLQPHYFR